MGEKEIYRDNVNISWICVSEMGDEHNHSFHFPPIDYQRERFFLSLQFISSLSGSTLIRTSGDVLILFAVNGDQILRPSLILLQIFVFICYSPRGGGGLGGGKGVQNLNVSNTWHLYALSKWSVQPFNQVSSPVSYGLGKLFAWWLERILK